VNAYLTGEVDPGLFVVTGHLHAGADPIVGEAALWQELERLKQTSPTDEELQKVRNKYESGVIFGEINVMNKAMNLGFYDMLGELPLINAEVERYKAVTANDVMISSQRVFREANSCTLIYKSRHESR
ncbi:MAG: insulinase family protein, partial [Rikenellaceae bacterium]|nr:insulinase family protein [Rikenellaceae bacterium]